jgi:cytochrome c biogenesis protein CcmG, thiol:disulfide interchange protein DsbE
MDDPTSSPRPSLLRKLEPLLWVGLALFLLARFGPQLQAWTGIGPPPPGEVVPAVEVVTLDHRILGPGEMQGKVQVITFWATWCRACRWELPAVQRLHEEWEGTGEVVVLALSIDQGGEAQVQTHGQERGYTLPMAMVSPELRRAFGGISGVPTTFLVDREGRVRHTLVGVSGPGTLQRAVRRLVEEGEE